MDVALRESRRIGKAPVVEGVVSIQVQCLHLKNVGRQLYAVHTLMIVPPREVMRILVDKVPPETVTVRVDVQFIVLVLPQQLGRIQRHVKREAQIRNTHAQRRFIVGCHLRLEKLSVLQPLRFNLRPRHVQSGLDGPLRPRARDKRRVDIPLAVVLGQHTVEPVQDTLRRQWQAHTAHHNDEQGHHPTPTHCHMCYMLSYHHASSTLLQRWESSS